MRSKRLDRGAWHDPPDEKGEIMDTCTTAASGNGFGYACTLAADHDGPHKDIRELRDGPMVTWFDRRPNGDACHPDLAGPPEDAL